MKARDKLAVFAASELLVLQWRHEGLIPPGVDILRNGTALGKPILKSEHSTLPFKLGKPLAPSTLAKHMARIRADSSLEPALLEAFVSKANAAVKRTSKTNKPLPSTLSGQVDGLRDRTLRGWALNRAKPFDTVYVDIYVEGQLFKTVPTNLFRPELKTEELSGNFGFEVELAANHLNGAKHQVRACFAESSVQLVGSPLLLGHGYFDAGIALTDDTTLSGWIKEPRK